MPISDGRSQVDTRAQTANRRLESLRAFLQQDPRNEPLRADVFDAALAAGAFQEAGDVVTKALAEAPGNQDWRHREGMLLLARGEFHQAQEVYLELMAEAPTDFVFRFNLAFAQFAQGASADAAISIEPLLENGSGLADMAWPLWLRCQHHLYRLEEGLEAFNAAAAHRLMGAEAWGVASLMALDAERLKDARDWADQSLRANPEQIEALVTHGSLALGTQDANEAMAAFERALAHLPGDGRSRSGTGFAFMLRGEFPLAMQAFRQALEAMPTHIGTWIGLGWCEFLAGDLPVARKAFEQALELDRNFAESHGGLAVVLAGQGLETEARAEVAIALKLDPIGLSARYAEALMNGEASNPEAFQRFAHRVLAKLPSKAGLPGQTLADAVLRRR